MSEENVEIVKALHPPSGTDLIEWFADDAQGRQRMEAAAPLFHPEFEFFGGEAESAGLRLSGRGLPELAARWLEWMEPWETYVTKVEDFIDSGADRVVVLIRDRGRLRGSDADVEQVTGSVWTLRDGKVARIEFYARRNDALEAAGLRE